ncbi:hypothetical protein GCM10010193_45330 [Kitasatospora atroaurantiaca]|uniref:MoxR-vWA-beta-propeller ternary system domain-containing protein n=1 Tax=Kitasatospora atroaurantiaca TaxID=285545 RepID=A0A561EZP0_9ACTN|nr:hypothetical protein [Kitasatospora atroaurantiaca]TWE21085.1 hypothetical protein FB465_6252 [Kitasatospora atroaurantiaca]
MTTAPRVALQWRRREPPLPAAAVVGLGAQARALAAATRERLAAGVQLRAVADAEALVVLGPFGDLPWVDGARYLGWDGGILVPTTAGPWPSAALWREALASSENRLVVLLPGTALVAAMPSRTADPAALGSLGSLADEPAHAAP